MMGTKTVEPKLYLNFSLDAAVPRTHIVRRLASAVDFSFVPSFSVPDVSLTGLANVGGCVGEISKSVH